MEKFDLLMSRTTSDPRTSLLCESSCSWELCL